MDFISINAYKYKAEGRQAHRRLLSSPEIIIIEDLDLAPLEASGAMPHSIIAVPLLVDRADGTPCTVFAEIQDRAAEKTT